MPARAHAGDAHGLREVAIGKAHPRAAKAALGGLFEVETRLERHALERRANCLASDPERSRRQRYRACRSRAAELDGPDHRAVTIDAAGAARAIETIKREKLAGYEASRGVGGEAFRAGRAGCKQDQNHHRQPSNHTGPSPVTPSDRSLLLDELPQRYRPPQHQGSFSDPLFQLGRVRARACARYGVLYRVPIILTLGLFPK